jgi:replicative DNA helicase
MTYVSQTVRAIAKELNVPLIALAQLRKRHDEGPENPPRIADLRESGSFETDADVVALLHLPSKYAKNDPRYAGYAEVDIAKQKDGPIGSADLQHASRAFRKLHGGMNWRQSVKASSTTPRAT